LIQKTNWAPPRNLCITSDWTFTSGNQLLCENSGGKDRPKEPLIRPVEASLVHSMAVLWSPLVFVAWASFVL